MVKKTTLAILKPGKYLMLNHNKYVRIQQNSSVLLLNDKADGFSNHRIALLDEQLLIVGENEVQIQ